METKINSKISSVNESLNTEIKEVVESASKINIELEKEAGILIESAKKASDQAESDIELATNNIRNNK